MNRVIIRLVDPPEDAWWDEDRLHVLTGGITLVLSIEGWKMLSNMQPPSVRNVPHRNGGK